MTKNTITMSEIENQIQGLILKTLDHEVTSDDIDWNDLLLISILDSVSTLALVTGLEDAFDVIVEDEELTEEMLTSTRSIAQYIYEKLTTDTHSFVSE
ncbi:MAG: hypothetical protein F4166_09730 [Gammaproteobacteria bacterium]|nr:hypothetical protein [Candidatus Poribacteria bacterium]MYF54068.1 hypothetical protein [Gammaproteobacteria bacterium]